MIVFSNGTHKSLSQSLPPLVPLKRERLAMGTVVRSSLQAGIQMKLAGARCVEDITAGKLLVVEGERREFFAMITEVTLDCVSPGALADPPASDSTADAFLWKALAGTSTFGIVTMKPMLMRDKAIGGEFAPTHFSEVGEATEEDIADIFGNETEDGKYFTIGAPLDMDEIPICLDLEKFVERSNGIFGKSGTGKTFLTRICLCGMIMHKKAINLVFDMHGEYGWKGTTEDPNREGVNGLKKYFGSRVSVFAMDRESSEQRNVPIENNVRIPYSQIGVEDIILLTDELKLDSIKFFL